MVFTALPFSHHCCCSFTLIPTLLTTNPILLHTPLRPTHPSAGIHERELDAVATRYSYLVIEVTDASSLGVGEGDVAQMLQEALHFSTNELQGTERK
jgi:hypothetical protein